MPWIRLNHSIFIRNTVRSSEIFYLILSVHNPDFPIRVNRANDRNLPYDIYILFRNFRRFRIIVN